MTSEQICSKCVLPSTFPGISFNDEGVCNHCQRFESFLASPEEKDEHREKLRALLKKNARSGTEVLMAYSGGKDSTYSMWYLQEMYGAKIEAFTFDNGFISPQAIENIKTVCDRLDIKHNMVVYPQDMMNKVFREGSERELYSAKTMERASTICTICSGFFKSMALAYSLENDIPMIGYGWSPGQAPIQSAIKQNQPRFVKMSQTNVVKPMVEILGEDARQYFLQPHHYDIPGEKWPYSIHPLAFEDYNEEDIKAKIRELGWKDPTDVDSNSTNCMLNAFANQVHLDRYKFHPYALEIANMVRQGTMDREEGIEKIYAEQNQMLVTFANKVLYPKESASDLLDN